MLLFSQDNGFTAKCRDSSDEERLLFGLTIMNPRTRVAGCMAIETSTEDKREIVTLIPMDTQYLTQNNAVPAVWDPYKDSWERGCGRFCYPDVLVHRRCHVERVNNL